MQEETSGGGSGVALGSNDRRKKNGEKESR